jgi:TatD DNase family protein
MRLVIPASASLPFDCHNHIQLGILRKQGPFPPSPDRTDPLLPPPENILQQCHCCGMSIMSTHPRDYPWIKYLSSSSQLGASTTVVPCFGIHPWFISELEPTHWELRPMEDDDASRITEEKDPQQQRPQWWLDLRQQLIDHPHAMVGELGLDRFHYTTLIKDDGTTGQALSAPIDTQLQVLEYQLELAIQYQRPVSIHCVHAFGMLLDSLRKLRQRNGRLPPKIYFHAYSGQLGTIPQILSICEPKSKPSKNNDADDLCCYFGFAPVVNFRSPKTPAILRAVGLERIVLETDVEEMEEVAPHLQAGLAYIAEALGVDSAVVLEQTTRNAMRLYNIATTTSSAGIG